jgi:two-component system cell cycle sensor histidine kinase/response regulator CckA
VGIEAEGLPVAAAGAQAEGLRAWFAGGAATAPALVLPLVRGRALGRLAAEGPALEDARAVLDRVADDLAAALARDEAVAAGVAELVAGAAGPVALFDARMRYLATSASWREEYGVAGQPLVGRCHYEVFPDLPERWREVHRRCLAGATESSDEDVFERADGGTETLRWTCRPWRHADGRVGGLVISSQHLTAGGRVEAALRATQATARAQAARLVQTGTERLAEQAMLRTLVDTIPDYVWLKDDDGRYLELNRRCEAVHGRPKGQVVGLTDLELFPREVAEAYRDHDRRAVAAGGPVSQDEWVTFPDGHRELFLTTKTPMFAADGRLVGVLGIARDVTAVRQAHAELAHAESELRKLSLAVEHSPVMVSITDTTGQVQYANPRARRQAGPPRDGRPWFIAEAAADGPIRCALRDGVEWRGEVEAGAKDGRPPYVARVAIAPVRDGAGAVTHFVTVEEDVSEARLAERSLREVREQLLHAQKMEAVGALAGGVAHDFNNLLTVITGFTELVLDVEPLGKESRDRLVQAHRAAQRAADLTRQLLAFSRKLPSEPRVVDLAKAVRELGPMLRRLIGEHLTLQVEARADAGAAIVDPGQLEQVVMNLVVNARDASRTGGTIRLEVEPARLTGHETGLRLPVAPGAYTRVSVLDTGAGMAPEVQARVFEPFFTTKPAGQGTGLGLATVYGILEQAGASLRLSSAPGRGTRFDLYFPTVDAASPRPEAAPRRAPRGCETILLVEDEPSVLELLHELLEGAGYRVLDGGLPLQALELAQRHEGPIDLVLSDMVMPQLDGPAVVARVREGRPAVRALFLSGYPGPAGATRPDDLMLPKPIAGDALLTAVRSALDGANGGGPRPRSPR